MMRLAADAVVDDPGRGRDEGLRQHLQHHRQPHRLRAVARQIEQQAVDRQRVEPVADLADDLRQPQAGGSCGCAQQAPVGGERRSIRLRCTGPCAASPGARCALAMGADALGAFAQDAGQVAGLGDDLAIALLERLQVRRSPSRPPASSDRRSACR